MKYFFALTRLLRIAKQVGQVLLCFNVLMISGCASRSGDFSTVKINNQIFKVQIADEPTEHYQGLSRQKSLGQDEGMLLVFSDLKIRTFVMRGMNFPLDIIWIKDDRVVVCEKDVPVLDGQGNNSQLVSQEEVNYVLEVGAGMCEQYKIKTGSRVDFGLR